MTKLVVAKETVAHLIDLLKASGGLMIDVQIEEARPDGALPSESISIQISGEDAVLFVRNNLELLKAVHQIAAAALDLDGAEHDLLWFDVHHLRTERMVQLQQLADLAVIQVRSTQTPHAFAPMLSCERHMLHQALASSALKFESRGEGVERCVVLYPEAADMEQSDEAQPVALPIAPTGGRYDAA